MERDDLEAAKRMMETKEKSLNQRIALFETHIGTTKSLVATDGHGSTDLLPRRPSITGAAEDLNVSGSGGVAHTTRATPKPAGFQLPTASFKPQQQQKPGTTARK